MQFDVALPFGIDGDDDDENVYASKDCANFEDFVPNGLGVKFGFGIQKDKWIGISAHTGLEWKVNDKLVVVPLYGNLRLSPLIDHDIRLSLQAGFGRDFAIGKSNLVGNYKRFVLGLESETGDAGFFIEYYRYDFYLNHQTSLGSFSLGLLVRWN